MRIRNSIRNPIGMMILLLALVLPGTAACSQHAPQSAETAGTEKSAEIAEKAENGNSDEAAEPAEVEDNKETAEAAKSEESAEPVYGGLFETDRVHAIDIRIAEEDWADLLEHPMDKTKYEADMLIDGELAEKVSFATKGNSSLTMVAADQNSDRYSFKVNFGKYVKGQTWNGVKKLHLLSMFHDDSCMRDFLSYDLFRNMGVDAPLCSYVFLTVNGKPHGLYIAVEEMDESFLARLGETGTLYKPEADMELSLEDFEALQAGGSAVVSEANGADLVYIDDDPDHYPDIFADPGTKVEEGSPDRVIRALKALSERKDLTEVLDTEEVIRYYAVQNYLLNFDSLSGPMLHNYYLKEKDGKLSMLPWDYNLAWGSFPADGGFGHTNEASVTLNLGMDSPLALSGVTEDKRPMWAWIPEDEASLLQYHDAMDRLLRENFENGAFDEKADKLYEMILPWVEKDPTAFYTPEEFTEGYGELKTKAKLRAESIRRQLEGTLAPVSADQKAEDRVDTTGIELGAQDSQAGPEAEADGIEPRW